MCAKLSYLAYSFLSYGQKHVLLGHSDLYRGPPHYNKSILDVKTFPLFWVQRNGTTRTKRGLQPRQSPPRSPEIVLMELQCDRRKAQRFSIIKSGIIMKKQKHSDLKGLSSLCILDRCPLHSDVLRG